jgi:hypothetical protein
MVEMVGGWSWVASYYNLTYISGMHYASRPMKAMEASLISEHKALK